jgi:tetratricopeptide (TPR) repeat protein
MRITAILAVASLPLFSQAPDAALFKGDPKAIMLACADKARGLRPKKAEVLTVCGRVHLATGDKAKADEAFKAALLNSPDDPDTYLAVLSAWLEFGHKSEALETLQQIRGQYPSSDKPRGWRNALAKIAATLMTGGLGGEAEEIMQIAYAKNSGDWQNMTSFARACLRAGRSDTAAKWFSLAVKSAPKDESIWNDIALSLADQGRENKE